MALVNVCAKYPVDVATDGRRHTDTDPMPDRSDAMPSRTEPVPKRSRVGSQPTFNGTRRESMPSCSFDRFSGRTAELGGSPHQN